MSRYRFFCNCPGCGMGEPYLHSHRNCKGYEEIDENGIVYCTGCNSDLGFLGDLEYRCTYHNDYKRGDAQTIMRALSLWARYENIPRYVAKKIITKIFDKY